MKGNLYIFASLRKREILQDLGDNIRESNKNQAYLAKKIIPLIKQNKNKKIIIDSFKNTAEIKEFRRSFNNFIMFAIDANSDNRWERLADLYKGKRELFDKDDIRDAGTNEAPYHGQQVKACMSLSDVLINSDRSFFKNNSEQDNDTIEEYGQKIKGYLDIISNPGYRQPIFDELYMHQACSISLKSLCLKRQVGAVIVKKMENINKPGIEESYIISTGCNNVPVGEVPCISSEGCFRDAKKNDFLKNSLYCRKCGKKLSEDQYVCSNCFQKTLDFPGRLLDLCRSVHAEEAAILQAAKLGISINDTIIYTSTFPCLLCSKKLINSGVKEIVYLESYPMPQSYKMLQKCGILIRKYEGVSARSFHNFFTRDILPSIKLKEKEQ